MIKIFPYKMASQSATALAVSMNSVRYRPEGLPVKSDVIINWGSTEIKRRFITKYLLNAPANVKTASNKLQTFIRLNGYVSIPDFSTSKGVAVDMLKHGPVVCRTMLSAHSGKGIVIAENEGQLVDAPLYTRYIPKTDEYRVHVAKWNGTLRYFVQRKARNLDVPDEQVNWKIRNHSNGFIFANQDVYLEEHVLQQCTKAIEMLGLDFGAVDVIYNKKQNKYFILEVNTAPGLAGKTLQFYTNYFKTINDDVVNG